MRSTITFSCALCAAVVTTYAQQPATNPTLRIVAFGDSTTATRGELKIYCDQLRDRFAESGERIEIFFLVPKLLLANVHYKSLYVPAKGD